MEATTESVQRALAELDALDRERRSLDKQRVNRHTRLLAAEVMMLFAVLVVLEIWHGSPQPVGTSSNAGCPPATSDSGVQVDTPPKGVESTIK